MADRYLLESGSPDGYLLEDGTGVLLLGDAFVEHLTTASNDVDATSFTTASISPTADRLVLAAIWNGATGANPQPTVTGNGLTWVLVDQAAYDVSGTFGILHLFRAMGSSPSSGAVTIDYGATTILGCGWSIVEWGGVDTSGTNGSGAIVQSVDAIGTSASADVTLAAFADTDNPTFAALAQQTADVETPGAGFTRLGRSATATPVTSITTFYNLNNDTSVDADWTTATEKWGIIGVEIKTASGESHQGSVTATGAGTATTTGTTDRPLTATATGAGTATLTAVAGRSTSVTATGAGTATVTGERTVEEHDGSVTATGAGTATVSGLAARATSITGTGAGTATVTQTTARASVITGTGAGSATLVVAAPRVATVTATGAGSSTITWAGAHRAEIVGTGAGTATITYSTGTSATGSVTATGGGTATLAASSARTALVGATGGGVATLSVSAPRTGSVSSTGAGSATIEWTGAHLGEVIATGGGVALVAGEGPPGEPLVGYPASAIVVRTRSTSTVDGAAASAVVVVRERDTAEVIA
ncbi:MAG TPA: hypothetical protein VFP09_11380 [Desertimonas sp.]|nr:hypothetical protein [Desertimonas sp.]